MPRIGVVSDSPLQLFSIRSALEAACYQVVIACEPHKLGRSIMQGAAADAWVVSLSPQFDSTEVVSLLSEQLDAPVLLDENREEPAHTPVQDWPTQLSVKLQQHGIAPGSSSGRAQPLERNPIIAAATRRARRSQVARHVWVLGASLGGPEALTEFLSALPGNLPLCLVYAQHIDADFSVLLAEVIARNTDYRAGLLDGSSVLSHGQLGVVPVARELRFRPAGRIEQTCNSWPGPYSPAIDQVISDIAAVYGNCSGAIIFSGMGQDGAASCAQVRRRGGSVWVQRPDSCICPAMPEAVIETGSVEFQASPAQLAQALAQRYTRYPQTREQP